MRSLAWCCSRGLGVEKNAETAVEWWTRAADKGDETAMFNVGLCFNSGIGVPKNEETAVLWWTRLIRVWRARSKEEATKPA
jgi:TPR repeat protein